MADEGPKFPDPAPPVVSLRDKQDVEFQIGQGEYQCRNCTHFTPGNVRMPGACSEVFGACWPENWCILFEARP